MVERVTVEQVRVWLDDKVVSDVQEVSEPEAEFNLRIEISRLPLHVIKEEPSGPLRIVGESGFDTDRVVALIEDERKREELLTRIGPMLAATPGFYTFFDENGDRCEFGDVRNIHLEHRIYPDGLTRHRLMRGVIDVAKAMRYIQNTVTVLREGDEHEPIRVRDPDEADDGDDE